MHTGSRNSAVNGAREQVEEGLHRLNQPLDGSNILEGRFPIRIDIPFEITEVPMDMRLILLDAGALVVDVDETLVVGSGEHIHDGPCGRFAIAVSACMNAHILEGAPSVSPRFSQLLQGAIGTERLSHFDEATWAPFRALTGGPEPEVIRNMCDLMQQLLDIEISPAHFTQQVDTALESHFTVMKQAGVFCDDGLRTALETAMDHSVKVAVCSASGETFVTTVLRNFGFHFGDEPRTASHTVYLDHVAFSAPKKTADGFSGVGFSSVSTALGIDPSTCIAVGDSISDLMGALLAGFGCIVIRTPVHLPNVDQEWLKLRAILASQCGHCNFPYPPGQTPKIFFVEELDQLAIYTCCQGPLEHRLEPRQLSN